MSWKKLFTDESQKNYISHKNFVHYFFEICFSDP